MSQLPDNTERRVTALEEEVSHVLSYLKKAELLHEKTETEAALNQARKAIESICKQVCEREGFCVPGKAPPQTDSR